MSCPIKSVPQTKQTSFKLVQHDYKNKWMENMNKAYILRFKFHNSNERWNNGKWRCECKKCHVCEKIMFGIPLHVAVKMENI